MNKQLSKEPQQSSLSSLSVSLAIALSCNFKPKLLAVQVSNYPYIVQAHTATDVNASYNTIASTSTSTIVTGAVSVTEI